MADKKMTPEFKETILSMLCYIPNLTAVSRLLGVNPTTVHKEKRNDPTFDADVKEAMEIGFDTLEEEARRRSVDGVSEPVYYQGAVVGHIQKYSDDLLKFLLKGYRSKKFNPGLKLEGDGKKVTMIMNFGGD